MHARARHKIRQHSPFGASWASTAVTSECFDYYPPTPPRPHLTAWYSQVPGGAAPVARVSSVTVACQEAWQHQAHAQREGWSRRQCGVGSGKFLAVGQALTLWQSPAHSPPLHCSNGRTIEVHGDCTRCSDSWYQHGSRLVSAKYVLVSHTCTLLMLSKSHKSLLW